MIAADLVQAAGFREEAVRANLDRCATHVPNRGAAFASDQLLASISWFGDLGAVSGICLERTNQLAKNAE